MRSISRFLLALLLLGCAAPISAQSVSEIVDKHLAASGGRETLGRLKSRRITGNVALTTPVGELAGTIEVLNLAPNKERTLITLDLTAFGAGQMTFDQRFDGTAGYVIDSLQGDRDITGGQLENMKNAAFPSIHLVGNQRGVAVALGGREKVGDRDAFVLVLTPKEGSAVKQYIDAESYLLVRTVGTVDVPQMGAVEQIADFSDYRDVDGVKTPFHVKTSNAAQAVSVTITKIEHDMAVDASLFEKPKN